MHIGWVFYLQRRKLQSWKFIQVKRSVPSEFIRFQALNYVVRLVEFCVAGLLALLGREPGQVRKEAAPATEASAGGRARHPFILQIPYELPGPRAQVAPEII